MISRYIVIALAFGVAVLQATRGAWVEATGLLGLGAGLVVLRVASTPAKRRLAWLAFSVTAVAIVTGTPPDACLVLRPVVGLRPRVPYNRACLFTRTSTRHSAPSR